MDSWNHACQACGSPSNPLTKLSLGKDFLDAPTIGYHHRRIRTQGGTVHPAPCTNTSSEIFAISLLNSINCALGSLLSSLRLTNFDALRCDYMKL